MSKKKEIRLFQKRNLIFLLPVLVVLGLGIWLYFESDGFFLSGQKNNTEEAEQDIHIKFLAEIYDKIKEHYWKETTDQELCQIFWAGAKKLTEKSLAPEPKDKNQLKTMLTRILSEMDQAQKQKFSTELASLVLANLQPFQRNGLYTQKKEKELENRIQNINPQTGKPEPTVIAELISPDIAYIQIKKMSPSTFEEFQKAASNIPEAKGPDSLILDLRGNVGGSIDILPYFLGHFIGQNQYAYEFFHQGDYTPFKTKTGWLPSLVKYKKVVILIDENTQSSAEVMAVSLKKYNVGVLVGRPTRGWGTVEKVFELSRQIDAQEKYSAFLVHSLTLRQDNQPIEGRGVEPLISIENPHWPDQLFAYFHYPELIEAVKELVE